MKRLMLGRWGEVAVYAVIVSVCSKLLSDAFGAVLSPYLEVFPTPSNNWQLYSPIAAVAITLIWLHTIIGFRFHHLSNSLKYPSLVIAVPLALISLDLLDEHSAAPDWFGLPKVWWSLAVYGGVLLVTDLYSKLSDSSKPHGPSEALPPYANAQNIEDIPAEKLLEWAGREQAITTSREDLFKRSRQVARVLGHLKNQKQTSVAIVGRFGSGKSSVVKLVEEQAPKEFFFVSVSCWGFDNPSAAQEAVLKQVVDNLSTQVDCFAIQGMPAKYVDALSATSNYLDVVFRFAGSGDPDAQLRRLSPILGALGIRLVVTVEDTDRPGTNFDASSIEGLLKRFRDLPEISFIVTAGQESKIDFLRLCEHTEVIPDLDEDHVLLVLDQLRKHCRDRFPEDVELGEPNELAAKNKFTAVAIFSFTGNPPWSLQLARLIATPRRLKATIRRFLNSWEHLHGEVDIDEFLIATTLRVCVPSAYGFLMRRERELRRAGSKSDPATSPKLTDLKKEWDGLSESALDLELAGKLVQVLAPSTHLIFKDRQYGGAEKVQQFASVKRDVYRIRIHNEALEEAGVRDQTILRAIAHARKVEAGWRDLAKHLEESEEALDVFAIFQADRVEGHDLWRLTTELYAILREKYGRKAGGDSEAFGKLCGMCHRQFRYVPDFVDLVYSQIAQCIPKHLRLAVDIEHALFVEMAHEPVERLGDMVFSNIKDALKSDDSTLLVNGLDEDWPYILNQLLIIGEPRIKNDSYVRDWKKWSWLGPILLRGVREHRDKLAPQIAEAFGLSQSQHKLPSDFIMNEGPFNQLFGKHAKDMMIELSKPFTPPTPQNTYASTTDFSLVNERANRWLKR